MKRLFDKDTWQEIFGSIQKNKVRTVITMIGVLWGIFIYIALSGSSKGLDNGFERAFQSIASNSIFVWAQSTSIPYGGYKSERRIQLKLGDVEILKKRVKGIKFIAPRNVAGVFGSAGGNIVRGTKTGTYAIYGEFPEYIKIATAKIYDGGRFINESDIKNERKVCVIGERTQLELFEENENPIGQFISINKINFRVVGVHKFVQGGGFGDDGDIYIPFATFRKIFNTGDNVGWFMIAADENIDGLNRLNECFLGLSECDGSNPCPVHFIVEPFKNSILGKFRDKNIMEFSNEIVSKGRKLTIKDISPEINPQIK